MSDPEDTSQLTKENIEFLHEFIDEQDLDKKRGFIVICISKIGGVNAQWIGVSPVDMFGVAGWLQAIAESKVRVALEFPADDRKSSQVEIPTSKFVV